MSDFNDFENLSPGGAIVLGLLLDGQGPRSGYDLQKQAATSVGHFWPVTKAHVYSQLPKLESAGFVVTKEVQQSGLPDKRVFAPTPKGSAALSSWLAQADLGEPKLRHPLLLKVFFAADMDRTALAAALDAHEAHTREALERYRMLLSSETAVDGGQERWRRLVVRYGVLSLEADLAWLAEFRQAFTEAA
jgi:DNA-binding PadR family transcriptional regulator